MGKQQLDEKAIFKVACNIELAEARDDYVQHACGNQPELQKRVSRLLQIQAESPSFLEAPAEGVGATIQLACPAEQPEETIGPYKLLEEIGQGGMGVVYMAKQEKPFRRLVALKIVKPGMDTRQVVARFEAERQALAMMNHPNIAKVLDAGASEAGRPYFAMELVKGLPITEFCDQQRLGPRQRLQLFITVCQAVQHAHQKGLIHRDLKPSNVMVEMHDVVPVPKIIDFGVAKAIGQQLVDSTIHTGFGQMIGTPLYMSPEQAGQSSIDVDTRSDVYSLGVVLYELLTGHTPFESETLRSIGYDEMRRMICEVDPPRPSARVSTLEAKELSTVSDRRRVDPRRFSQQLHGELDWIIMKALEKDRDDRYESASALAADVERYLCNEPVEACPHTMVYRLKNFARRNKARLITVASIVLMLWVTGGLLSWSARDRALRFTAIAQNVESALQSSVALQKVSKWNEALAVVKGAQTGLSEIVGSQKLRQLIESQLAELQMVIKLDEIAITGRTRDFGASAFYLADPETERKYAQVFREFGIDAEKLTPAQATELIQARGIRKELVTGLEYWAAFRAHSAGRDPLFKQLLNLASSVDPDPWRDQLRAAWQGNPEELLALLESAKNEDLPMSPLILGALPMLELFSHNQLAIELLRQAWFRRPDEFWVLFELGQLSPNPDDAIRFCTGALAIRPHTEVLQNELSVQFYRKKDYNEAIAHAREAIRLRTGFAYAHLNLGRALTATGLHEGAMVAYRAAIEIAPNFWEAHYDLADELHDLGLFDAAIAEYRETICFNSNFLEAQLKLWDELHRKGQSKDAFDEYRKMIPFNSNFLEMHLKSWDELRRYGQLNVALDEYREALRLKPDEAQPRIVNLGKRLLEQKEFADAEAVLRECVASSEATDPDRWTTFNRKSLLAGSLLGQAQLLKTTNRTAANEKLTEAEPLLLVAYPGLKDRETKDPSFDKSMLTETIDRLVMLYTHLDKSDEVAKWQTEFDTRH